MNSPEQEKTVDVLSGTSEIAAEQTEKLRKLEATSEKSPEKNSEQLVADARKEAESIFSKESGKERRSGGEPTSPAVIRKITKREKARAYKQTLIRVQSEMSTPARTFSKVIHSPIVEKTSEVVGSTAARPNALLFGAVTSFFSLSLVYAVARTYGYQLSGFEMIAAYGFGWACGLIIDYFKIMASGKASS